MDLLELARGPALQWSFAIMVFGIAWRLLAVVMLGRGRELSQPRSNATARGAVRMIIMRSWPHREFLPHTWFSEVMGWTFHLGYFAVFLLAVPHVLFIESVIGFGWPALPGWVVSFLGGITLFALVAVLIRRLTHPVLRLLSNFDDYASWVLTTAPLVTGLVASLHLGGAYETLLAVHILSVEALMLWFPFGKLMHAFFIWSCRAVSGAAFARKGVSIQ